MSNFLPHGTSILPVIGQAHSVIKQPDGKLVLVGGRGVVRLNTDGSLDTRFGTNGIASVSEYIGHDIYSNNYLGVQADGKLVLVGHSANANDYGMVRLNDNGSLDSSFGTNGTLTLAIGDGEDRAKSVVIQPDGKLVVAGYSQDDNGSSRYSIARLKADGSLDTSFATNGKLMLNNVNGVVQSMIVQPDSKLILVGSAGMVRLNADGSLDSSFGNNGISGYGGYGNTVMQSDGKLLWATNSSVMRLNADGSIDSSFINNGSVQSLSNITNIAIQPDGKVMLVGSSGGLKSDYIAVRLNADGSVDSSFGTNGTLTFDISGQDSATSLVILPDGKVVLVGSSQGVDFTNYSVARLNADGSLDTSFANALPVVANAAVVGSKTDTLLTGAVVATDANGDTLSYRLLRAAPAGLIFNNDGTFSFTPSQADQQLNGTQRRVINVDYVVNDGLVDSLPARLSITINGIGNTPRGKLILPVGSGHDYAHSVIQQSDGKLVVAGYSVNGTDNDYSVVRLNSDGTLDTSFANGGKLILPVGVGYDEAKSLITQADGKIVLAGYSRNGASYDYSAVRLNSNGSIDTSFGVNGKLILPVGDGYDEVKSMIMQPDGKWVLVGLSFNGSNNDYSAVRFNSDGSLDTSFGVNGKLILPVGNGDDAAQTAIMQSDGKLVLAGYSSNGTNNDYSVVRLNNNGSVDTSFGVNGKLLLPVGNSEDYAYSVAIQSDGKLVLAGRSVNGNNSDYSVVRLNANGTLDTSFANGGILMLPVGNYWDEVRSVMLQADGKVVLTGRSHNTNSYYDDDFSAVRLNSDGSLDASFGIGGKLIISVGNSSDTASGSIIQTDGKLVVVGGSDNLDNNEDYSIVRLNSNGGLDGTFANQAPVATSKAVFGSEDDRPITGTVQATDANNDTLSYRLVADAPVGLTFNSNGSFRFTPSDADQFLSDGQSRIVNFSYIANDGQADSAPANVTLTINGVTEGKLIVPLGGYDIAQSVIVQPDGKLVIAGVTDNDYSIVRLNSDGSLDASFSDDGKLVLPVGVGNSYDTAYSVTIQADGKLVLAGSSRDDNNNSAYSIVRLNSDGSLDTSFSGDGKLVLPLSNGSSNYYDNDIALSVAIQADGKLVLAGRSGGDYGIVRLNNDGTLDASFGVGGKQSIDVDNGSGDSAYSVTIQADGKLVLAGSSGSDYGIVRLNSDGTLDASFGVGGKQSIDLGNGSYDAAYSVAIQSDGKLVLAGSSQVANNAFHGMIRLNSDGSLDSSFGIDGQLMVPAGNGYSSDTSAIIQADGKLLLAGVRSTLIVTTTGNSTTSYYSHSYSIMRFNNDGSFDSSFGAGGRLLVPVSNAYPVLSAALQADGKLVLTGTSSQNYNNDYVVMRINADGSLDSGFGNSGVMLEVPIASNIAITGTEDDSLIIGAVLATDVNGDPLSYRLVGEAPAGLTFNSNGTLSYLPSAADQLLNDGQSRVVMFDYVANDGQANSAPATVSITVNGITDAGMAAGVDGGQTVIERNPDGTTTYTHNNGGNGSDWQQTFNSQGYLVTQVDNDQNHTELWVSRTATLNSTGQLLQVEMTNDDNSRDVLTLDANNSQVWKQQNRHFDMTGSLDYIVTTNDDGSTDWQDQDNGNSHTWTTINSHQTTTGALDWYRYINDDGTQDWLDLDQDSSQAWMEQAVNKNAFGQDVQRTVIFDDNTRDVTLSDVNNVKVWQQNTQHFNANGVYQGSDVLLDTGIAANQVWLRQNGNNLEVSQMGTNNKILIADWFTNSPASQKTNFQLASGGTLLATEVQALVTAMASFSPPLDGQTSLTTAQHQALDGVIAANWS